MVLFMCFMCRWLIRYWLWWWMGGFICWGLISYWVDGVLVSWCGWWLIYLERLVLFNCWWCVLKFGCCWLWVMDVGLLLRLLMWLWRCVRGGRWLICVLVLYLLWCGWLVWMMMLWWWLVIIVVCWFFYCLNCLKWGVDRGFSFRSFVMVVWLMWKLLFWWKGWVGLWGVKVGGCVLKLIWCCGVLYVV